MKDLELNDLERLAHEMSAVSADYSEWAVKVGLDPDLLEAIGNVATNNAYSKTQEMAREAFAEKGITPENVEELEELDGMAIKMDVGEVIKAACINMFALGFETHRQFGGTGDRK